MILFSSKKAKNDIKDTTVTIGRFGETAACKFLRSNGWKIVERNWRFSHLEIDIIAKNKQYLIFVEVKTRHFHPDNSFGTAAQAVNRKKRENLIKAAEVYLSRNPSDIPSRMDIIEVYTEDAPSKKGIRIKNINHIESAYMRR